MLEQILVPIGPFPPSPSPASVEVSCQGETIKTNQFLRIFYDLSEKGQKHHRLIIKNKYTKHFVYFILTMRPQSTVYSLSPQNKNRIGEKSGGGGTPTQSSPTGSLIALGSLILSNM